MSRLLYGACKMCKSLQFTRYKVIPSWYHFLSRSTTRYKSSAASGVVNKTTYNDEYLAQIDSVFESLEVADEETFLYLKESLSEKVLELKNENIEKGADDLSVQDLPDEIPGFPEFHETKRKKRRPANTTKHIQNQLTHQGEKNVLSEIEIYIFLGEIVQAYNLFNYHRRHGHKFDIDTYNKMIHGWAVHKGWKNIRLVQRNISADGLTPNYQTYAAMLQCCGIMQDEKKTKEIVADMQQNGFDIYDIFQNALLTKQQIAEVLNAMTAIDPDYKETVLKKHEQPLICDENNATVPQLEGKDIYTLISQQLKNEAQGVVKIKSIEKLKGASKRVRRHAQWYEEITQQWRKDFIQRIEKARQSPEKRAFMNERLVTFTTMIVAEDLAEIMFEQVLPLLCAQPGGMDVQYLCRYLGRILFERYSAKFKQESGITQKIEEVTRKYCTSEEWIDGSIVPREKWMDINASLPLSASENIYPTVWPTKLRTMLSGYLLNILKEVAVVDTSLFSRARHTGVEQCITHSRERTQGVREIGLLKTHPLISRLWHSHLKLQGDMSFCTSSVPMLIPPRPWVTATQGAYLILHSDLVRTVSGQYKLHELSKASKQGQLSKLFDSINYLGNCPWKVNTEVLDIMIKLFNDKGDMKLDIIGPIDKMVEQQNFAEAVTTQEKRRQRKQERKLRHELFALRMDLLYKLSMSNHFRDATFWIPNNLDFRGRVYPIAHHCSHIGNDASRGLLLFANGKPLGEKGLDWLKVHLVNIHGHLKKSSLKARIEYADQHIDDIIDSADHPLDGRQWWKDGDDPWQTLVACMEIRNALRSGDPATYVSHVPVHIDGSCNGLQHYASLGHDEYGARQVNLMAEDRPQDVYSEVAHLVERTRAKDASEGNLLAQQLQDKVNRKVVKQTVMTVVYGVTFVGGRLQIEKQLKELSVSNDIIFKASVYIVQNVFQSLQEMFTSARQIQDWLTQSAAQIALAGHCVDWVTPLGLPVVQPYHKETTERLRTKIQSVTTHHKFDYTQAPHLTKQKGGFPPNFVHSLDSSHMMMTSIRCRHDNMTFASVHDSFWTHACDIDKLNTFCREEFVNLHQLPILEDLKKHFDNKFSGLPLRKPVNGKTTACFDDLPKSGSFDVKQVLNAPYFFS